MTVTRCLVVVALLHSGSAWAQWCVPSTGPDTLNTYGPTSPVITNVTLNTIDRTTAAADKELYVDTGLATDLVIGQSYPLSMTYQPDFAFCPDYQLRVWIDWDQNGSFLDPGETVVSVDNDVVGSVSADVDVPATAVLGTTRMRVAMKMELACGHDAILPCPQPEAFGWHGEIEDYDIEVVASGACDPTPVAQLMAVKSNLVDVELTWSDNPTFSSYSVYAVVSEDPAMIEIADGDGMITNPVDIDNVCKEVAQPCLDPNRIVQLPDLVFYQVVGVCPGGEEGPIDYPSLSDVQASVFTPSCAKSGCHSGGAPAAGMNLEDGAAFANLVDVPSAEQPLLRRIAPGDPADSYLIRKVEGDPTISGVRMPADGPPYLTQEQLDELRAWVLGGALK